MKLFRSILFWLHLVAGLVAGLFIGIMCFTGAVLAFEDELVAWSEHDARQVAPPAVGATRLSLAELQRRLRAAEPDFRPASIALQNDPAAAIAFSAGRDDTRQVNPYTGEVRRPASTRVHDFMHVMTDWHRFLGREGENRAVGKLVNGICNLAFGVLAVTGLYLWWPRTLSWRGVRTVALFNWRLAGKARDFNWHNVIGLWTAPVLIVLTLTAVPISFRWGGNLIYRLAGEEPPGPSGPGGFTPPAVAIERPAPDTRPLSPDEILASVQPQFPRWEQITLRTGGLPRGPRNAGGAGAQSDRAARANPSRETGGGETDPRRDRPSGARARGDGESRSGPQALTVTVRESGSWPRTATTTLTVNPFTGETLNRFGHADQTSARRIRSWTRFLHTGQALGWPGQFVAGLACFGGLFLVYTGFALSYRRFFVRNKSTNAAAAPAATTVTETSV